MNNSDMMVFDCGVGLGKRAWKGSVLHKVPVFETAGHAYRFLLHEAGTILRLSWFPLVVVTIVQYLAVRAQFAAMRAAIETGGFKALSGLTTWHWQLLSAVATIFGTAVVAVALHRVILFGQREPGRLIHLAFGKVELLFAALPIIMLVPVSLLSLLVFGTASAPAMIPLMLVVMAALWGTVLFVFVRLSVIFPITVIEGRYQFGQAWHLTQGNFWRLVALWIVVFLPLSLVGIVITAIAAPLRPTGTSPMAMLDLIESRLPLQMVLSLVWSLVGGALGVAALSYSYKALIGRHPDDIWTPES